MFGSEVLVFLVLNFIQVQLTYSLIFRQQPLLETSLVPKSESFTQVQINMHLLKLYLFKI